MGYLSAMQFVPPSFSRNLARQCSALLPLLMAGGAAAAELKGLWLFEDSTDLGKATIGTNLTIFGTPPAWAASATYGSTTLSGVITTQARSANRLLANHHIGANGGNATRTADYTLAYDVRCPAGTQGRSFYQTDLTNAGTAEYLTRGESAVSNSLGHPTLNYTTFAMPQEEWVRLVIAVKLGTSFTTYLIKADGTVSAHAHAVPPITDPDYSLEPSQFILFGDGNGQNNPLEIGQVAVFDEALAASEVSGLGGPGITLTPPVIEEGSGRVLQVPKNGAEVDLEFNEISSSGPIMWEVTPGRGKAVLGASATSQCTVRYTPAVGHVGIDSFAVHATNSRGLTTSWVTVYVRDPAVKEFPVPVGWWQFDHPTAHPLATLGADLVAVESGFAAVPGIVGGDGAVEVAKICSYKMTHGIPAGTGGGSWINRYTLLFDIKYTGTAWKPFFRTRLSNGADSQLFIEPSGQVGGNCIGGKSTQKIAEDAWCRVVVTVDNGTARRLYVNGELWYNGTAGALDDLAALPTVLPLFTDNDGEDGPIKVTNLAIWSSALDADQVAALGAAGFFIDDAPPPAPNYPPVITEGATRSIEVTMAVPTQLTFHVTDRDNDAIRWTISQPAHGTAEITASTAAECTVTYTSLNSHAGPDCFTLSAADEKVAAAIAVTLNVLNIPPVIAGGDSYLLNAPSNGGSRTATFTATDANANALSWSISPAQHGTARITASTSGICQLSYTPNLGFVGADRFVVQVSDGEASDSVSVTATVGNPSVDPVLTVVSAHGTTNPPPGNHPHPPRTPLSPHAADEMIGDHTRYLCAGWTLAGDEPASGTGNSFAMTLTRPSILTWQWRTEYRVVTTVNGSGSVSVASGWQPAGQPLQITATPAPGHYFAGWTGDLAGCDMAGKNIVLPMTRADGNIPTIITITANFAPDVDFTVIALPDTQFYTSKFPDRFSGQTQWVLANRKELNIQFLTHLGDLVETATNDAHWTNATGGATNGASGDAMNLLNGILPYGTCPGNHDLGLDSPSPLYPDRELTAYLSRFGPNPIHPSSTGRWIDSATGQRYPWYGGASPRGYSSYQTLRINGRDFLFLHLDHDCPDEDMAWAKTVLNDHPQSLTMITTHNYLAQTGDTPKPGQILSNGSGTGKRGYTFQTNVNLPPNRNRPEVVFNELVKPYNQVYMVICGHMSAVYHITQTNAAGNHVHEVLSDYQSLDNGGNGFLRIMKFSPTQNTIFNDTYSPTLGRYIDPKSNADKLGMSDLHNPDGSRFELDLDFDGRFNSTLAVAAAHGSVSPAHGPHAIRNGTPVVVSAEDHRDGLTRFHPTGWILSGAKPSSGHGHTATITPESDATLAWSWDTEYWLDTATLGHGTVTIQDGWQLADTTVTILAEPDAGETFLQWGGDIADCTRNGNTITVPMNRPRGEVTAVFSPTPPICTLAVVSDCPAARPAPGFHCYPEGSVVNFAAWPWVTGRERQVPVGWAIAGANPPFGTPPAGTLTLAADATLTWSWAPEVYLELATGFEGTILPLNAAGWKPWNATVALEARPAPKFHFTRWNGDVPANSTLLNLSLVMNQPRRVAADATPDLTTSGTPHWWLDGHARVIPGLSGNFETADLADADRDGTTAHQEFLAGTNDLAPSQRFQVFATPAFDGPACLLTWSANPNRNYFISRSPDLTAPFVRVAGPFAGTWPSMSARVPATGNRNFFRVEAVLPPATSFDADSPAFSPVPASGSLVREMSRIPAGWFTCGDDSSGGLTSIPAHATWVAGFYMDRFEVTRRDWETVAAWAKAHGYDDLPVTLKFDVPGNHPAVAVKWVDAVKWCNARSEMAGLQPVYHTDPAGLGVYRSGQADLTSSHVNWAGNGYRLPTEAEWERAARGGLEGQPYPWCGDNASRRANHWDYALFIGRAPTGAPPYTQRVGFFDGNQPGGAPAGVNAYGLHDLVGNAWEWTWDRMGSYNTEPQLAPRGPDTGAFRVLRGGSWRNSVSQTTTAQRLAFLPAGEDSTGVNGFRCLSGLPPHEGQ